MVETLVFAKVAVRFLNFAHIPALQPAVEGRQDARLLERGGEPASVGWSYRAALGAVLGRDQGEAWRKTIEVQDEGKRRQVALFPAGSTPEDDVNAVGVRLMNELRLERPRQWGACWLSCVLRQQLDLDSVWRSRLPPSRQGTAWLVVLQTLVAYRLRSGLRMAAAPPLVRCQRDGRSSQCRLRAGREKHAVPVFGQARETQGRAVQVPGPALG